MDKYVLKACFRVFITTITTRCQHSTSFKWRKIISIIMKNFCRISFHRFSGPAHHLHPSHGLICMPYFYALGIAFLNNHIEYSLNHTVLCWPEPRRGRTPLCPGLRWRRHTWRPGPSGLPCSPCCQSFRSSPPAAARSETPASPSSWRSDPPVHLSAERVSAKWIGLTRWNVIFNLKFSLSYSQVRKVFFFPSISSTHLNAYI